jgi:hypothetical protein
MGLLPYAGTDRWEKDCCGLAFTYQAEPAPDWNACSHANPIFGANNPEVNSRPLYR